MKKLTSALGILFLGCFLAGSLTSPVFATPTLVRNDTDNTDQHLWIQADLQGKTEFNGFTLFWNIAASAVASTPLPNLNYTVYWPSGYEGPTYSDQWSIPVDAFSHFHNESITVEFWLSQNGTIDFENLKDDNFYPNASDDEKELVDNGSFDFLFAFYDTPLGITNWAKRQLVDHVSGSWSSTGPSGSNSRNIFFTKNNVLVQGVKNYRTDFIPTPEPSTWVLLASGLGILLGLARRKTASVRDQL
jgi:hypothetical protein